MYHALLIDHMQVQRDCILDFDVAYFSFFSSLGSLFLNSLGYVAYKGALIKV